MSQDQRRTIGRNANQNTKKHNTIKMPDIDSAYISKILPDDLYKSVAEIIGLDVNIKEKIALEKKKDFKKLFKGVRYLSKALQAATQDKEEKSYTGDTYVEPSSPRLTAAVDNPYYDFLQRPLREQVKWPSKYLPPETEKEKGLVKRADELTNQICKEFSTYLDELGGYDSPLFRQENIKTLFQIEFNTHAAKSLRLDFVPMKCIPKELANFTGNSQISYENTITNNIKWDIDAEKQPPRKLAFNRQVPKEIYYRTPTNNVKTIWKPGHYPQDLALLECVWGDILNYKSVQDYSKWILNHPKVSRPKYLRKNQMFQIENLEKLCEKSKYNHENTLPPLSVEKFQRREEDRYSPLPEDLKIKIQLKN